MSDVKSTPESTGHSDASGSVTPQVESKGGELSFDELDAVNGGLAQLSPGTGLSGRPKATNYIGGTGDGSSI